MKKLGILQLAKKYYIKQENCWLRNISNLYMKHHLELKKTLLSFLAIQQSCSQSYLGRGSFSIRITKAPWHEMYQRT
jgi:hypothetical protein